LLLYRGRRAYVLLNLYPYNCGHLMVAPYAHGGDLVALAAADRADTFALVQAAVGVLRDVYRPDGFNVGMNLGQVAGAGVPDHLHVHVVPRWAGDTNFMPIVGDTKVLPESLAQTYDRLRPAFAALAAEGDA
jgi:ATP adenylyltransferase